MRGVNRPPRIVGSCGGKRSGIVAQIVGVAVHNGVDLTAVRNGPDRMTRHAARRNAVPGAERGVIPARPGDIEIGTAALDRHLIDSLDRPAAVIYKIVRAVADRRAAIRPGGVVRRRRSQRSGIVVQVVGRPVDGCRDCAGRVPRRYGERPERMPVKRKVGNAGSGSERGGIPIRRGDIQIIGAAVDRVKRTERPRDPRRTVKPDIDGAAVQTGPVVRPGGRVAGGGVPRVGRQPVVIPQIVGRIADGGGNIAAGIGSQRRERPVGRRLRAVRRIDQPVVVAQVVALSVADQVVVRRDNRPSAAVLEVIGHPVIGIRKPASVPRPGRGRGRIRREGSRSVQVMRRAVHLGIGIDMIVCVNPAGRIVALGRQSIGGGVQVQVIRPVGDGISALGFARIADIGDRHGFLRDVEILIVRVTAAETVIVSGFRGSVVAIVIKPRNVGGGGRRGGKDPAVGVPDHSLCRHVGTGARRSGGRGTGNPFVDRLHLNTSAEARALSLRALIDDVLRLAGRVKRDPGNVQGELAGVGAVTDERVIRQVGGVGQNAGTGVHHDVGIRYRRVGNRAVHVARDRPDQGV